MDFNPTKRMVIDASLLRAQRMRNLDGDCEDVPVAMAFVCICCRGVYSEHIERCPKDGRVVLPFARLGMPVISRGEAFYAQDPVLSLDDTNLLGQSFKADEEEAPTMAFTLGLCPDDEMEQAVFG
jgi:hypothetical protein